MKKFRSAGFTNFETTAGELAQQLDIPSVFPELTTLRARKKKRHFDEEQEDQPILNPRDKFKIEFFNVTVDQTISSLSERFDQLKAHSSVFSFLYDIRNTGALPRTEIVKHCKDLEIALQGTDQISCYSKLMADELTDELVFLVSNLPENSSALQVLEYISRNSYEEFYENTGIALRIFLTLPVSVASGERDFFRLKLIKTYLRSIMTQERLSDLAIISSENDVCNVVDFDKIFEQLAESKARKVSLEKL